MKQCSIDDRAPEGFTSFNSLECSMFGLIGKLSSNESKGWECGRAQCHSITDAQLRESKGHPKLGDAWKDPSGIVWIHGEFVERGGDGTFTFFK